MNTIDFCEMYLYFSPWSITLKRFLFKKIFLSFSKYKKNKLCYKVDFVSESDFCLFYFIFISHKLTSVLTALNFTSSVCGMSDERNSFLKEMWKKYCIVEQCQFV